MNVTCRDRVEPGGGLVKKQDLRVTEQRPRQRDALAKAFRQRTAEVVRSISEVDCLQRPLDAIPHIGELVETSEAFEVLRDGEPEVEARDSGMIEMRARIAGPVSALNGMPAIVAVPDVGAMRVPSVRTVVVFPAPFGPRKPKTSP